MRKEAVARARVSSQMITTLDAKAKEQGAKRSALIVEALNLYLGAPPPAPLEAVEVVKRVVADFARVGGNLNQIAYHLNAGHVVAAGDVLAAIEELRPHLNWCVGAVQEVKRELIRRER